MEKSTSLLLVMAVCCFVSAIAMCATAQTPMAFLDTATSELVFGPQVAQATEGITKTARANHLLSDDADTAPPRPPCADARNAPALTNATHTDVVGDVITVWQPRMVARGDSVSRLRQEYRGAMSGAQYDAALLRKNPQLTDLNVICAGYTINVPVVPEGGERTLADALAALKTMEGQAAALGIERTARAAAEKKAADLEAALGKMQSDWNELHAQRLRTQNALKNARATIMEMRQNELTREKEHAERLAAVLQSNKAYTDAALALEQEVGVLKVVNELSMTRLNLLKDEMDRRESSAQQLSELSSERDALKGALESAKGDYDRATWFGLGIVGAFSLGTVFLFYISRRWKDRALEAMVAQTAAQERLTRERDKYSESIMSLKQEGKTFINTLQEECDKRAHVSLLVDIPEEDAVLRAIWGTTAAFAKVRVANRQAVCLMDCGARPRALSENVLAHITKCKACQEARRS